MKPMRIVLYLVSCLQNLRMRRKKKKVTFLDIYPNNFWLQTVGDSSVSKANFAPFWQHSFHGNMKKSSPSFVTNDFNYCNIFIGFAKISRKGWNEVIIPVLDTLLILFFSTEYCLQGEISLKVSGGIKMMYKTLKSKLYTTVENTCSSREDTGSSI